MNKYREDIESFMVEDDLSGLLRYVSIMPEVDKETQKKLLSLKGRLAKLESDQAVGLLSQDETLNERNKIRYGILQITSTIETNIEVAEKKEENKRTIIKYLRQYAVYAAAGLVLSFIGFKIYDYASYIHEINLPFTYIGKKVDPSSVHMLHEDLQNDSTIGNEDFNYYVRQMNFFSQGRDIYLAHYRYDSTGAQKIVSTEIFEERVAAFYEMLAKNETTFGKIYQELEYQKELEEVILRDSIQKQYKRIDDYCLLIQDYVGEQYDLVENIKQNVKVELINVEANKRERQIEARTRVINGSGKTIYSVTAYLYAVSLATGDTVTELSITVDQSQGIQTVYTTPLDRFNYWNQPDIYEALKNYRRGKFYFISKIRNINVEGELMNIKYFYPKNVPYDADFIHRNQDYTTPEKLDLYSCPYLSTNNKLVKEVEEDIESLTKAYLKEKGFQFMEHREALTFRK